MRLWNHPPHDLDCCLDRAALLTQEGISLISTPPVSRNVSDTADFWVPVIWRNLIWTDVPGQEGWLLHENFVTIFVKRYSRDSFHVRIAAKRSRSGPANAEISANRNVTRFAPSGFAFQYCRSLDCGVEYSLRSTVFQSEE